MHNDPGLPSGWAFPGSCSLLSPPATCSVGSLWALSEKGPPPWECLLADGELYTGTVSSFQGNDPAISRSQSPRPTKTESSLNWLQDPAFVASAYIPESLGSLQGDDDKIYFFFSETGQEFEFFENTIVSRIARICKVRGWAAPEAPRGKARSTPGGWRLACPSGVQLSCCAGGAGRVTCLPQPSLSPPAPGRRGWRAGPAAALDVFPEGPAAVLAA